jgi:NitT/TauT family transport system ATP-binding protein
MLRPEPEQMTTLAIAEQKTKEALLAIEARNLSVTYSNGNGGLRAIQDISFRVQEQEFVCVLGPSGSGKSTLLRVLAGLLTPTQGEVFFYGEPLKEPRREIGFVFQKANLMPWRTVLQNILLPLELQNVPPAEARQRAMELIDLVGLRGFEDSLPRDLSGGMAQRVAIARALIHDPQLLLLDEPFGGLDALTRERMGDELLRIWQARQKTVVMVTHSIPEAIYLSDRILVFTPRPGKLRLDLPVYLPRPRKDEIRYSPAFGELSKCLRAEIG